MSTCGGTSSGISKQYIMKSFEECSSLCLLDGSGCQDFVYNYESMSCHHFTGTCDAEPSSSHWVNTFTKVQDVGPKTYCYAYRF